MKNIKIVTCKWIIPAQHQVITSVITRSASYQKLAGFSLVEMLMALLVASLLMAALAPVMTKKLNDNFNINIFGSTKPMEACAFMTDNADADVENVECKVPNESHVASAIIVSGGGGGGGATPAVEDSTIYTGTIRKGESASDENATSIYAQTASAQSVILTRDISDIEIEMVSGGEGGGIGNTNQGGYPANQNDCGNWGVYVDYKQNATTNEDGNIQHSICVSRYNPSNTGDGKATPKSNITGVTNVNVGTNCSGGNCCWNGATSTTCQSSGNGFTYSGCNRTVCQWNAADIICKNWNPTATTSVGRLPAKTEFEAWAPHIKHISSTQSGVLNQPNGSFPGLQLCGWNSDYGALQCHHLGSGCPGTFNNICYPNYVWSGTSESSGYYGFTLNNNGNFGVSSYYETTRARGVRCVVDSISQFKSYTGAGGGSGTYFKIKIPNETLKKAFNFKYDSATNSYIQDPIDTLSLRLIPGKGGKAGDASRGPYAGSMTQATIYRNNERIFIASFYGGGHSSDTAPYYNNANAAINRDGIPYSSATSLNTNGYFLYQNNYSNNPNFRGKITYNTTYDAFMSEGVILDAKLGKSGNTVSSADGTQTGTTLGAGAASYWRGSYKARERDNTPATAQPGSGGLGGYCIQGPTRLAPVCTEPTPGTAGAIKLTYKRNYPGLGGNGGNAGSVLHIKGIQVNPGEIIKVKAGAGGSGGNAGSDGRDGGNSDAEFSNGQKYEVLGGKGGKTGIPANPSTATFASPAEINSVTESSILTSATKTYLNSINYEVFPSTASERAQLEGKQAPATNNDSTVYQAEGGNGGANPKISALAGVRGIPCGAFSKTSIKIGTKEYKCGTKDYPTSSYIPSRISRILSEDELENKASNYSKYYAPGTTGGAGAGWINDYSTGESAKTGQGGDGMGGYVLIYFSD